MERVKICKACHNNTHNIKTRLYVPHTCEHKLFDSNQDNPLAPLQTKYKEHLKELKEEIDPEVFDRLEYQTFHHFHTKHHNR